VQRIAGLLGAAQRRLAREGLSFGQLSEAARQEAELRHASSLARNRLLQGIRIACFEHANSPATRFSATCRLTKLPSGKDNPKKSTENSRSSHAVPSLSSADPPISEIRVANGLIGGSLKFFKRELPQKKLRKEVSNMRAMPIVLTLAVAAAALYIILSGEQFTEVTRNWAYGVLAGLLGYWLRHQGVKDP
jgi:hypothetical protein